MRRLHQAPPILCVLGAVIAALAVPAVAQTPSATTPLRLVLPYPAGTTIDVVARLLAEGMGKRLGRPVVVDNRPGVAGSLAVEHVAGAPADGSTALLAVNSQLTVNPLTQPNLRIDPLKVLKPVAMVLEGSYLLVAHPQAGYKDLPALIAAAKARPGAINYASYGIGSMPHLCAEQLQATAQIRLNHVPYKGSPTNDLVGGNIEVGFEAPNVIPFIKSEKLVGLGVTSQKRLSDPANLPTVAEVLPGFECVGLVGLLVPADTPEPTRAALEQATLAVAGAPEFAAKLVPHGLRLRLDGQQAFATFLNEDKAKWTQLVKDLNLKLN